MRLMFVALLWEGRGPNFASTWLWPRKALALGCGGFGKPSRATSRRFRLARFLVQESFFTFHRMKRALAISRAARMMFVQVAALVGRVVGMAFPFAACLCRQLWTFRTNYLDG